MHYLLFLLPLFMTTVVKDAAQHCPFDGSNMVVLKLINTKGKPLPTHDKEIILYEKENPKADSCTYAQGQLAITFGNLNKALIHKYENSWVTWAKRMTKGCDFMKPGHIAVVLNMAQSTCMVNNHNQYVYYKRAFEIAVKKNGATIKTIPVDESKLYNLCTSAGSWHRITPIDVVIEN
jgi:hypothetical protein